MGVQERIQALVEPLKSEERTLIARRDELQVELGGISDELKQVQRMLRLADPDSYETERDNGKPAGASEGTIARVLRTMWAESTKTWTIAEIAERTDLHTTSVSNAIQALRHRGDVRNMGRTARQPGQVGTTSLGFKISEGAVLPQEAPAAESAKPKQSKSPRQHVSQEKVDEIFSIVSTDPSREWTRVELKERLPWHRSQVDFACRVLEEDGKLIALNESKGHDPVRYRVVTDGS